MKILPQYIFNSRDPIVMGVTVEAGQVKQGTPMCVPSKNVSASCALTVNASPEMVTKLIPSRLCHFLYFRLHSLVRLGFSTIPVHQL